MNTLRTSRAELAVQEYIWNRGRITFLYVVAISLLVVILLVYVWQWIRMVEIQMDIKDIEKREELISEKTRSLQLEKAELSRLERIDFTARERLGMVAPSKENIIYMPVDSLGEK